MRSFYLHNGISYTGNTYLHGIWGLDEDFKINVKLQGNKFRWSTDGLINDVIDLIEDVIYLSIFSSAVLESMELMKLIMDSLMWFVVIIINIHKVSSAGIKAFISLPKSK